MTRITYKLSSENVRKLCAEFVGRLQVGQDWQVTIADSRTLEQNAAMWALLSDFAEQVIHCNGQKYPKQAWKLAFMQQMGKEAHWMPSLDGSDSVPIGYRSSELSRAEMKDLLTLIESEGAARGVIFTDPRDKPEKKRKKVSARRLEPENDAPQASSERAAAPQFFSGSDEP